MQNIAQISVHLLFGIVSSIDLALTSLGFFDPSFQNFQQPISVEIDRIDQIDAIIN